jgi:hypothetical protein
MSHQMALEGVALGGRNARSVVQARNLDRMRQTIADLNAEGANVTQAAVAASSGISLRTVKASGGTLGMPRRVVQQASATDGAASFDAFAEEFAFLDGSGATRTTDEAEPDLFEVTEDAFAEAFAFLNEGP